MNEYCTTQVVYTIPASEQHVMELIDADWTEAFGVALLLLKGGMTLIRINGSDIDIGVVQHHFSQIRWINASTFLVAAMGAGENEDSIFIVRADGTLLHSFFGGDSIAEIVAGEEGIWISYSDEGIFGDGISSEGLVLFDLTGQVKFRYHTDLPEGNPIDDCYAMSQGEAADIWIFSYSEFRLTQVNSSQRAFKSVEVPERLHGAHALHVQGKNAFFYGPYEAKYEMYSFNMETRSIQPLGKFFGKLRGLGTAEKRAFLSVSNQEVVLYQV